MGGSTSHDPVRHEKTPIDVMTNFKNTFCTTKSMQIIYISRGFERDIKLNLEYFVLFIVSIHTIFA